MARRVTRRQLLQQLDELWPPMAEAFSEAFVSVRAQAQITRMSELIAAGRLDTLADELGINSARFSELTEEMRNVYMAGGRGAGMELPTLVGPDGSKLRVGFDMRNPRAETWLRNQSSKMVTEIIEDQRNAIRIAVSEGTLLGNNPRTTALDLIGRIGPNGRRSGGIVGLTSQQTQYVVNARNELASGDPKQMARYFTRQRRDRRFDSLVQKAMDANKPISSADMDKIIGRYSDRLLQLRGENIARTEALTAFNESREEAFRQAVDTGRLNPKNVRKVWSATMDGRTREAHASMNGMEVGLNEPFNSPTGAQLRYPGDTSLGAGGDDLINCRCMVTHKVDQIAQAMEGG